MAVIFTDHFGDVAHEYYEAKFIVAAALHRSYLAKGSGTAVSR
jgi:hypothetical protein